MSTTVKTIRLAAGAGYSGDRIEPAVELARDGDIDYLVFECLAERTIALAQQERLQHPDLGYDPLLSERMSKVLPYIRRSDGSRKFRIVSNMGAANPLAAMREICRIASRLGIPGLKVAAVLGDDVLDKVRSDDSSRLDIGVTPASLGDRLVSANAYLGAGGIVEALESGADVIVTGRVADPALYLAPQVFEFGWDWDDWEALGRGTLVGHLLECAGQVTGGYFADPGMKAVEGLERLGFPIAEVASDGKIMLTKLPGTGGQVTRRTCAEQLVYEIHDPAAYLTPDVTADFSGVRFLETGPDRVEVAGAAGHPRPQSLKLAVGYLDGYIGEGQISYCGPNAVGRAKLALAIVRDRLALTGVEVGEVRTDLIGVDSICNWETRGAMPEPWEVRLRVAARCQDCDGAIRIGNEVESLYTNGPAGGGGVTKTHRRVLAVGSMLLDADGIEVSVKMEESR